MQFTSLDDLTKQCRMVTDQLEILRANSPAATEVQPLFGISGLTTDLQRLYAIDLILIRLESMTYSVQAEVAEAISDLLETIGLTYRSRLPGNCAKKKTGVTRERRKGAI
jgi:hypothetical protein